MRVCVSVCGWLCTDRGVSYGPLSARFMENGGTTTTQFQCTKKTHTFSISPAIHINKLHSTHIPVVYIFSQK